MPRPTALAITKITWRLNSSPSRLRINRRGELGGLLPAELRRARLSGTAQTLTEVGLAEDAANRGGNRFHRLRIEQDAGVATNFRKSARVGAGNRYPVRHRLDDRQAEAFVQGREDESSAAAIARGKLAVGHIAGEVDPLRHRTGGGLKNLGRAIALWPHDDQVDLMALDQRPECLDEPDQVLAGL